MTENTDVRFVRRDGGIWPHKNHGHSSVFLSVVAPCFNEEHGLPTFLQRVIAIGEQLAKPFEIVLVNDGSTDRTWRQIKAAAETDHRIVGVNLSRNFGQEQALTAGLSICSGEYVLILDADLQDPPELMPQMLAAMEAGVDVVYGQRRSRAGESWFKRISALLFYRLMDRISEIHLPRNTGQFRLVRQRVVAAVLQLPEPNRYVRGLFSWVGFHQIPFHYDRDPRHAGVSHWSFQRMISFAMDAVCAFSRSPLTWIGCVALCCGLSGFGLIIRWGFTEGAILQNARSLPVLAAMFCFCGMQMLGLFMLGQYVGRIAEQTKQRPLFVVESVVRKRSRKGLPQGRVTDVRKYASGG